MNAAERRRLAVDLRSVCMRISRRVRFSGGGVLPPHQVSVLSKLDQQIRTPRELAEIECVSAPSMTRTVNALVEQGFVRRDADPDDGRQVRLQLTPEGRKKLAGIRRSRDEWVHARMRDISDEECEVLRQAADILERVVSNT
ncbi:MarR family transcriptional regulator [Flexivirga oryzae]|uniref:DNA-binding MarR family transcriptional regulator n=1 Tax=Flexivirga oryzae TaxID=1794944 RepID=A0A839N9P2_9MICO|nr:DNA-binding MarR family transcriptional regulator [Flexivirga oryzae]